MQGGCLGLLLITCIAVVLGAAPAAFAWDGVDKPDAHNGGVCHPDWKACAVVEGTDTNEHPAVLKIFPDAESVRSGKGFDSLTYRLNGTHVDWAFDNYKPKEWVLGTIEAPMGNDAKLRFAREFTFSPGVVPVVKEEAWEVRTDAKTSLGDTSVIAKERRYGLTVRNFAIQDVMTVGYTANEQLSTRMDARSVLGAPRVYIPLSILVVLAFGGIAPGKLTRDPHVFDGALFLVVVFLYAAGTRLLVATPNREPYEEAVHWFWLALGLGSVVTFIAFALTWLILRKRAMSARKVRVLAWVALAACPPVLLFVGFIYGIAYGLAHM